MNQPFKSGNIIKHCFNNGNISTFLVGFDIDDAGNKVYRLKTLVKKLMQVIHEFAFGFHEETETANTHTYLKLLEAAKAVYKIDAFQKAKDIYLNNGTIKDDVKDQYLRKGEFGELILHLLLRDFHETLPLLSKIYFKDSLGFAVHGFDSVHVQPKTKTLWLGESKLYIDGKSGIRALVEDIHDHFNSEYLESEFILISKKIQHFDNIPEKEHWLDILSDSMALSEQLDKIKIPLLCTYESPLFSTYDDESQQAFIDEYKKEMDAMFKYFDEKNDHPLKSKLDIILILFPVQNKTELVKALHNTLSTIQSLHD